MAPLESRPSVREPQPFATTPYPWPLHVISESPPRTYIRARSRARKLALDAGAGVRDEFSFMADPERFARAAQAFARGLGRIGRERARAGDVTPQQAETLQLIAEKGALSTSVLASLLGIDPSTASRNLAGLQRAGLISRKKAPGDGRQTDVRLTPRGRRMADLMTANAIDALAEIMDQLPRADRQRVMDALEMLARLMGELRA